MFAKIKNSKTQFKSTLTFMHKYKELVFQTSIKNFLFGKLFLPVIIRYLLFLGK